MPERDSLAAPNQVDSADELRSLVHAKDWSQTPIGEVGQWSPTLKILVDFMLANRMPMLLWWGADYISIYNDAYRPILGTKHPGALGMPFREVWPEIAHVLTPLIDTPFGGGPATWMDDILLEINRYGFTEETHFTIAYSPVPDDAAARGIGGVIATVHETTEQIIGERRIAALRDLGSHAAEGRTPEEACALAALALQEHRRDVPFALIYLLDEAAGTARLAAAMGVGDAAAPPTVALGNGFDPWKFAEVLETKTPAVIEPEAALMPAASLSPWSDSPRLAMVLPLRSSSAAQELAGFFVGGVSPRLRLDDRYRDFLGLVVAQVATAIANARAYDEERKRAEALAEIDRAKTLFFSNVSHEFRTPLSLILGPATDALDAATGAADPRWELVHRNALRLLKLVNSLLDFSRIEAGRMEAAYVATDLPRLTAELASNFRSACERAGLVLTVDCPPLSKPVHVDRDMWEKIVLNLQSNAFKFTFEGEISVALRDVDGAAQLTVRDTGVGIPRGELDRLFERFHRIEGQRSRTHEGSGIGLALVLELVKLHGGTIGVESELGRGTTFTVRVPFGTAHLPPDRVGAPAGSASTSAATADAFVQEALRWLPDEQAVGIAGLGGAEGGLPMAGGGGRVLLADDNADMRDYIRRLLRGRWEIGAVADGRAALRDMRDRRPDLVLADIMMPELDGFALLREIRGDPALRDIPVILLSARAGEESRVEGLAAGADDYMVKPFSGRELIARVSANLELARVRAEGTTALRASERRYRALVTASSYAVYRMSADWTEMIELEGHGFIADTARPRSNWLRDYIEPEDQPAVREAIRKAIGTKSLFDLEHRVRRLDGSLGWTHSRAVPTLDEKGDIVEWFGAASDVTDRKRAETALRELNENLEQRVSEEIAQRATAEAALRQSQKMEAIGQLTGGIAHDFNNLLAALGGSLSLIERRLADGRPGIDRYVQTGQDAVRRAATLTQRLLAFSRRQNLDPRPLDANRLIFGMEDLVRRTVGPSIEVEIVGAGGLWATRVDAAQLESSLLNLCINARDAMAPDGGRLTIETANKWLDERAARERDLMPGQYVSISVTDTGSGMTPEIIEKAFDPFFTTKPIGQGSGLGLSMVYGFVRQSGGQVRIYSEPQKGTTVGLYLPRHIGDVETAPDTAAMPRAAPSDGETVLVVDDEPTLVMLVSDVLEENGYQVLSARNGAAALEVLRSDVAIDLLLTDVGLPGALNGRRLADEARRLRPGLKVLFITGFAENAVIGHGLLEPGMEVLTKPFEITSLASRVREMIDR